MTLPVELPLFPLNVVLFPGMPLPLHIFEKRYKRMLARCLASHVPFGVVLIRNGQEVGGPADPHRVGTSAVITGVEQSEGDYNVTTVGCDRFRIEEITQHVPYLVARVRPHPFLPDVAGADAHAGALKALLERYLDRLASAVQRGETPGTVSMPTDPAALACLAGIVLQVPLLEKQSLLEIASLPNLLAAETALLRREIRLIEFMLRDSACPTVSGPFLAN